VSNHENVIVGFGVHPTAAIYPYLITRTTPQLHRYFIAHCREYQKGIILFDKRKKLTITEIYRR